MSLAMATAWASSSKGMTVSAGPKISSCAMRIAVAAWVNSVGCTQLPPAGSPAPRAACPPTATLAPSARAMSA